MGTHHYIVADNAVVRNMAICENIVIVSYYRKILIRRGAVRRRIFAENIVVPDSQARIPSLIFKVVRLASDERVRENLVALAQNGVAIDSRMVGYNSSGPYLCGASYVGVSANFDVGIELRAFFYNSTGVNFRHFVWIDYGASLASIIANISSAEDATLPSTLQVPSAQTNFCPRDFVILTSICTWSPGLIALRNLTLSALIK